MVCKESDEDRCCDGSVEVDYGVIALEGIFVASSIQRRKGVPTEEKR